LFFILNINMRVDVPNVLYIDLLEFLMRGVEIKLELAHIVELTEFITRVGRIFNKNLIKQHSIFQRSELKEMAPDVFDLDTKHNLKSVRESRAILMSGDIDDYLDHQYQETMRRKHALSKIKRTQHMRY